MPVDIRVAMPVMRGVKVFAFYRGMGKAEFSSVEMKRRGPEKVGRIPAQDVQGKALQYYIEARDKAGALVKSSGSQSDPNIVMIDAEAAPHLVVPINRPAPDLEPGADVPLEGEMAPQRNIDEEAAPLPGTVVERPERVRPSKARGAEKRPAVSKLALAGYITMGLGAVIAAVGGGVGFYYAGSYATAVRSDACPDGENCQPGNPYVFGAADPTSGSNVNDKDFQDKGHMFDTLGAAALGVGGGLVLAGATMAIVDHFLKKKTEEQQVRPRARPQRPVEEMPSESSLLRRLTAAPIVTPTTLGMGAGFTF